MVHYGVYALIVYPEFSFRRVMFIIMGIVSTLEDVVLVHYMEEVFSVFHIVIFIVDLGG